MPSNLTQRRRVFPVSGATLALTAALLLLASVFVAVQFIKTPNTSPSKYPPSFPDIYNSLRSPPWHSSLLAMYDGTAFGEMRSCASEKVVAEEKICLTPIERDIAAGRCVVYSFGVAPAPGKKNCAPSTKFIKVMYFFIPNTYLYVSKQT
jgi:hypothetical protein